MELYHRPVQNDGNDMPMPPAHHIDHVGEARRRNRLALSLVAVVFAIVIAVVLITACSVRATPDEAAALPTVPVAKATPTHAKGEEAEHVDHEHPEKVLGQEQAVLFTETYRYKDGVTVKVRVLEHGQVAARDAHGKVKPHEDYVQLEARVLNGGHHAVEGMNTDWILTYGPKGQEAIQPRLTTLVRADKALTGTLKPGQARVTRETFVVPCLCQDQAVLELTWDTDGHMPAVFTGGLS